MATWVQSDAWIFCSISGGVDESGRTDLARLVEVADVINHALPTDNEIEGAIRRLVGAGLIVVTDDGFTLTEEGASLAGSIRGGLFGQVDHALKALRAVPVSEASWTLDPRAVDDACQAYLRKSRIYMAKNRGRQPRRRD
jgi:hypothetical protein